MTKHFALPEHFEPFVEQDVHAWLLAHTKCGDPWWGDEGWCSSQVKPGKTGSTDAFEHLSQVILSAARDYNLSEAVFLAWMEAEQPTFHDRAPATPANPWIVQACVGCGVTDDPKNRKEEMLGGREQLRQLAWLVRAYLDGRRSPERGKTVSVGGVKYGPLNALEGGAITYATNRPSIVRRCARVVAIGNELADLAPSPPPPDPRLRVILKDTNEVLPYRVAVNGYHPEQGKCYVEKA